MMIRLFLIIPERKESVERSRKLTKRRKSQEESRSFPAACSLPLKRISAGKITEHVLLGDELECQEAIADTFIAGK
jgi:hypothetical protein